MAKPENFLKPGGCSVPSEGVLEAIKSVCRVERAFVWVRFVFQAVEGNGAVAL